MIVQTRANMYDKKKWKLIHYISVQTDTTQRVNFVAEIIQSFWQACNKTLVL